MRQHKASDAISKIASEAKSPDSRDAINATVLLWTIVAPAMTILAVVISFLDMLTLDAF